MPTSHQALEILDSVILAHGTADPLTDATTQARLAKENALAVQVELELAEAVKPLLRQALEKSLQAQADKHGPVCPLCGAPLTRTKIKACTLRSQWGEVSLRRVWGYCPKCKRWSAPADHAMALPPSEQNTPLYGETLAYLGTKLPASEAAEVVERVLGDPVAPSRVERQTRRAGQKAWSNATRTSRRRCSAKGARSSPGSTPRGCRPRSSR